MLARTLSLLLLTGALAAAGPAQPASAEEQKLGITTDVTWASQYVIDGFQVGGRSPVWELAGKVDLFSTGFSFMPWTAIQAVRSNREFDEQDLFVRYSRDLFLDGRYAVNVHGFYDYWLYPNSKPVLGYLGKEISFGRRQGNKLNAGVSALHLFPIAGSHLVPTYDVSYLRYWALNRSDMNEEGMLHQLLLDYSNALPRFMPGAKWQYYGLSSSVTYNTGAFGVRPAWSHCTATLTTGAYVWKSIFELGIHRQWTFEKTVNLQNEFWTTLSYILKI